MSTGKKETTVTKRLSEKTTTAGNLGDRPAGGSTSESALNQMAKSFWSFSCAFYERGPVKQACLFLQDHCSADINLILLMLWLARRGQTPDASVTADLKQVSNFWQEKHLAPAREARRKLKGRDGYKEALEHELMLEKAEQQAFIEMLGAKNLLIDQTLRSDVFPNQLVASCAPADGPGMVNTIATLKAAYDSFINEERDGRTR